MSYPRLAMVARRFIAGALILAGWSAAFVLVFYVGPKRCRDTCSPNEICNAVCITEPLPWLYAAGTVLGILVTAGSTSWFRRALGRRAADST